MKSVVLSLALAISSPALAAQPAATAPAPPAATAVDPAALAAAERLMDAMNYDKLMDQMMDAMVAQAKKSIPAQMDKMAQQTGKSLPADFREKLTNLVMDSLFRITKENKGILRREMAKVYARHFTVAEIDRMAEIQKDPVMVKMLAKMPEIAAESVAISQTMMADEMPRMLEDVKKMVADYLAQQPDADAS
jgi:hypothetical protein